MLNTLIQLMKTNTAYKKNNIFKYKLQGTVFSRFFALKLCNNPFNMYIIAKWTYLNIVSAAAKRSL